MLFTYNDIETLSGVAKLTIQQWKYRGLIPEGEFDEAICSYVMWLGEMTRRGVTVGQAAQLYAEGMKIKGYILLLTADGPRWLGKDAYKQKLKDHFEDEPFFFAVSFIHWFGKANEKIDQLRAVRNFRTKVGFVPTEGREVEIPELVKA